MGDENSLAVQIDDADLARRIEATRAKLKAAGIEEAPSLLLQWMPDA